MTEVKNLSPVSLKEFEKMKKEEQFIYELIDGVIMMSPRPAVKHQRVMGHLYIQLALALHGKNCEPFIEIDLVLDGNHLIPDILIDCNNLSDNAQHSEKPPLIAIEIVSPSSASRDYIIKRRKYEFLGIKEYWIVSPEEKCITVFDFDAHTDVIYYEGQVTSSALSDVSINLEDIFA